MGSSILELPIFYLDVFVLILNSKLFEAPILLDLVNASAKLDIGLQPHMYRAYLLLFKEYCHCNFKHPESKSSLYCILTLD